MSSPARDWLDQCLLEHYRLTVLGLPVPDKLFRDIKDVSDELNGTSTVDAKSVDVL